MWRDDNKSNMYECRPNDIRMLAELLKEDSESSDEDDLPNAGLRKMGPGDVKTKIKMKIRGNECDDEKKEIKQKEDPKAIWSLDEVEEIPCTDDILYDPREKPEYDITYRQNISTEDVYLQLGNRTPMTTSCEIMSISVKLCGEAKENIDCNLSKTELDLRTHRYRLHLPLPHPVDPDSSQATWSSKDETLKMTLQLNRELDFANF